MNYDVPNYVEEDDQFTAAINAATSAALSAALALHDPGEDMTSELVWEKGPVEQRVAPCPASHDAELQPVQLTVPKTLFMDENEMATWLLSSPEDFGPTASATQTIPLPPACKSMESAAVFSRVTSVDAATTMPWAVDSANERKRKAARSSGSDTPSEEAEEEWDDKEGSSRRPPRRPRSAQVHNMSERRRRDRINEKMKALRELIPRCNKMDKASMLEDAIEYTKSLQMQHRMMSMGYAMFPMMYPGMQQYLSPIDAAAIRKSAEAGGTQPTHPMMPFSPTAQGSTPPGFMSYSTAMPNFRALYPYPMALSEQARAQGTDSTSQGSSALPSQCLNQAQTSSFPDSSYHHRFGYYPFTSSQNPHQENPESMDTGTSRETRLPESSNG